MDDLDLSILASLQSDGRRPFTDIAQELGVSEGTVRNRVSKLIDKFHQSFPFCSLFVSALIWASCSKSSSDFLASSS